MAHMPKPATEYVVNFQDLNGGINLSDLEHMLTNKESPAMRNLLWREGVLCSRDGQEWVIGNSFYNLTVMKVNIDPIQDLSGGDPSPTNVCPFTSISSATVTTQFGDDTSTLKSYTINFGMSIYGGLLNALNGELKVFTHIASYAGEALTGPWLSSMDVFEVGTTPTTGAEVVDLGAYTTVQLTAVRPAPVLAGSTIQSASGDVESVLSDIAAIGYTMYDRLFHDYVFAHIDQRIYKVDPSAEHPAWSEVCDGVPEVRGTFFHYYDDLFYKTVGGFFKITYDASEGTFTGVSVEGYIPVTVINASPSTGSGALYQPENRLQSKKTVRYNAEEDVTAYHLPVVADSVVEVKVDGVTLTEGTDYSYADGVVTFTTAPPVTDPPTNNTVEITYSKANPDSYDALMSCPYAITYGGTGDLCVVMGGCPAQPNAFFWNGNHIVMDATYFPMSNYQLAGDTDDMITGFGKQQSFLVVFKEHSIGRAKQNTEEIDGRVTVDMPYMAINDKIGCDLPWSIQLIDNNLVWCNTEQGVHILKDSSYAYENNIECVSLKVNRSARSLNYLLNDVRQAGAVCSVDDTKHYWLCANNNVWVWDYSNSNYKTPSWYFFTNIKPVAFLSELDDLYHLNIAGQLTKFTRFYRDYDGPIDKSFRFTVQYFGGYDRLKNVNSTIIVTRPDTNSVVELTYITDYETRKDLTDLSHIAWLLVPRDLSYRSLEGSFRAVFRRRPMCRRVKHFTMQLDNNIAGQDLSIVSAQIFYNYQGRLR